jgi:TDG/mug DNA glycosylase family protein
MMTKSQQKYTNIKYKLSKDTKLLFVGINPSPGTYARGVPFSNNKSFWYLLHEAGILPETREELKDDTKLKNLFLKKFTCTYQLGLMNVVERPTKTVAELKKKEAIPGAARIRAAINKYQPNVVCFVGKSAYQFFAQIPHIDYGWQNPIGSSRVYVMHFPLHGPSQERIKDLRKVARAAGILKTMPSSFNDQ